MSSLSASFADRVQEIKVEIYQVLVSYKIVFIHRAKTACICGELHSVQKGHSLIISQSPVTPTQDEGFRHILQQVSRLKSLFQDLSEQNYIQTIIEKPINYVKNELNSFREAFNEQILSNNLMKAEPCPLNENQLKIDDYSDIQELVAKIHHLIESDEVSDEQRTALTDRLHEYDAVLKEMQLEEEKNMKKMNEMRRILTPQEIADKLKDYQKYVININDYEMMKRIGSGGFAEVYLGYHRATEKYVAIKKLHAQTFNVKDFEMFRREVAIASSMNHFAILSFAGFSITPPFCILTDFMSGGCLFTRLHKGPMLDPTQLTITALGVACGMQYIHEKNMLHRDLKSLNVLLDADDYPKICDFGISRTMPDDPKLLTGGAGTSQWMAPEVIASKPYSQKADVYSYGILLWELLTKDVPFHGLKEVQVAMAVLNQDRRPLIPQSCPPALGQLIRVCWDRDPNKRPEFKTIAKAFQSGKIYFPGTKKDRVKAYIDQFMEHSAEETVFDPNDACIECAKSIKAELKDPSKADKGLSKLKRITDIDKWADLILSSHIIKAICNIMKTCDDIQLAFNIILVLDMMLKNDKLLKHFLENKGSSYVLDLFIKFGTTSMGKIIDVLSIIIHNEPVKLSSEHLIKLAPFLVSGKIGVRKLTIDLIIMIIDKELYDDDSSLNVIANRALENSIPEAETSLLEKTLALLDKLLQLQQPFDVIIRHDGPCSVFSLARHKNADIRLRSLQIMNKMLSGSIPRPKIISTFFGGKNYYSDKERRARKNDTEDINFSKLVSESIKDKPDIILETLIAIGTFLKTPTVFKELSEQAKDQKDSILDAFRLCFTSDSVAISLYSMKLCFAFLSNQLSYEMFSALMPDFIMALNYKSQGVNEIAGYCIIMIIQKTGKFKLSFNDEEEEDDNENDNEGKENNDNEETNKKSKKKQHHKEKRESDSNNDENDDNPYYNIIKNFLYLSLQDNTSLKTVALRLSGVLSASPEGIQMLKNAHATKRIAIIATSDDGENTKLALMVIASHSALQPTSKAAISIIPYLFKMLDKEELAPYPLISIANLCVNPIAAKDCVPHLSKLVDLLDSDDIPTLNRTFTALYRILKSPEACGIITEDNVDVLSEIAKKTEKFWNNEFAPISFDIIEMVSGIPNEVGKKVILNSKFKDYLKNRLESVSITDMLRPILNRIGTRIGVTD